MKQVYMIQAHTGEKQLMKLIDTLLKMNSDVFVHIDKKNESLYRILKEQYVQNDKVFILDERKIVNWSGFSQVEATLSLMKAVQASQRKYDYIHLISGQDFPIKNVEYMNEFLYRNYGKEFMEYRDINQHWWRLKCYNFFREHSKNRSLAMRILDNLIRRPQKLLIRRNNLKGYKLYFGSSWFTITQNCMSYILEYVDGHPEYIEDFKYTSCPDEHFFQIIIMNSHFKGNVMNNNLRYIDWSLGGNSPKTLTLEDWESIKTTDKLIARKFDMKRDNETLRKIEKEIVL